MNSQSPNNGNPITWPYVALAVLLAAIGNHWSPDDVRALGYVLLALLAVGHVTRSR
jgi:hypothetical protein